MRLLSVLLALLFFYPFLYPSHPFFVEDQQKALKIILEYDVFLFPITNKTNRLVYFALFFWKSDKTHSMCSRLFF